MSSLYDHFLHGVRIVAWGTVLYSGTLFEYNKISYLQLKRFKVKCNIRFTDFKIISAGSDKLSLHTSQ